MTDSIDIVIPWVDGSDPEWRQAFEAAKRSDTKSVAADSIVATGVGENDSPIRYRDWDTLRYLLRGIERFAPWVRCVHLVTWGHLPDWLINTATYPDPFKSPIEGHLAAPSQHPSASPSLNIVRHSDFIPAEYLPTFSSRTIELNAHRIKGLSERFVLFNDDMFLCRPVSPERFFRHGLPCDIARLSLIAPSSISHTVLNMTEILGRRHSRRESMRRHFGKWFSPRYGLANLLKTLDLSVWQSWPGLTDTHMPQPYLRSEFERMWHEEGTILDATCRQRLRSPMGVNHWLIRYEQLATGRFSPVGFRDVRLDHLSEDRIYTIERYIRRQQYAMICLNDSPQLVDFEGVKARLIAALQAILPDKSRFER